MTPEKHKRLRSWLKTVRQFAILVVVLTSFRSTFADWNDIPSSSMEPTVLVGDRVFVNRLAYDLKIPYTTWHLAEWGNPQRGQIVVFRSPADGTKLIKRVIGAPGDTVELRDNVLFLNGARCEYQPLPDTFAGDVSPQPALRHGYATENLAGVPHPVMSTPEIRARRNFGPVTVPPDSYLMLGDNRDVSADSRYFGFVPRSHILGRATRVVLSLDHEDYYLPRSNRWLKPLE